MYMNCELLPKYEHVKSYYGKASIEVMENHMVLFSYGRKMIDYDSKTDSFTVFGPSSLYDDCFSRTTNRHMKEFLFQILGSLPYDEIKKHCAGFFQYGKFYDLKVSAA